MNNETDPSHLSFPHGGLVCDSLPPMAGHGSQPLVHARAERPTLSLEASPEVLGRRGDLRWPGYLGPFEVWSGKSRLKLVNFSIQGLGIAMPVHEGHRKDRLALELRQHRLPFARLTLEVMHAKPMGTETLLGGRVRGCMPLPSGMSLPGMGDSIELQDGLRASVLKRLDSAREPAVLFPATGEPTPATISLQTTDDGFIVRVTLLAQSPDAEFFEGPVTLEATLSGASFSVQGRLRRCGENQFVLDAPRIFSVGRREHGRVLVPDGHATVDWRHPLDASRWVSARVLDLSPKGLRLALALDTAHFLPPPSVPMLLRVGGIQIPIRAEVRYSAPSRSETAIVGLHIEPQIASDATYIARAYQSVRFPMLVPRAQVAPESVDELMRSSGYLSLRERTNPALGWHSPRADEELTVDLVHRGTTGKPIGHVSCLRVYPRTWLFHQLATIGLRRDRAAYPLYVQIAEWTLAMTSGEAFALAYFNQGKSWHQTMLGDFLSWVGSDSLSTIVSLDRWERSGEPYVSADTTESVVVREAACDQDENFARELARSLLPPLVADALHVFEGSISTKDLCTHHSSAGLERSRTVLMVEVDGQPEGAALCETGSRTLSLFNILNMAHVFFKRTIDPRRARSAQTRLLRAVLEFYETRGVLDPLVVAPRGSVAWPEAAGLSLAESMGCWVASREGIKQWKNYIHFTLGAHAERRPKRVRHVETRIEP